MSYVNWKIAKSELQEEEYSKVAKWCNESRQYEIKEIGDDYCVVKKTEPTVEEQNEQIRQTRASLYAQLIDPLHSEKQRKVVLGEWTNEMETAYVAEVARLTELIQSEHPYVENVQE